MQYIFTAPWEYLYGSCKHRKTLIIIYASQLIVLFTSALIHCLLSCRNNRHWHRYLPRTYRDNKHWHRYLQLLRQQALTPILTATKTTSIDTDTCSYRDNKHWHRYLQLQRQQTLTSMLTPTATTNIDTNTYSYRDNNHWHRYFQLQRQ